MKSTGTIALVLMGFILSFCSLPDRKGAEQDIPIDGKADSFYQPTQHGLLELSAWVEAEITETNRFHAFDFQLQAPGTMWIVTQQAGWDPPIPDTVVYLYKEQPDGGWGRYIAKNDDKSQDSQWSELLIELDSGFYRILVKGHRRDDLGKFVLRIECIQGAGCEQVITGFLVPVISENDYGLLSRHNQELIAAGKNPLPDTVFITGDDEGRQAFSQLRDYVDELGEEFDIDLMLAYADPEDYQTTDSNGNQIVICYQGLVSRVPHTTESLIDNVFSDQFTLYAWKYGDIAEFADWMDSWDKDFIREEIGTSWEVTPLEGDGVELVFATNDSGDNVQIFEIGRCQD